MALLSADASAWVSELLAPGTTYEHRLVATSIAYPGAPIFDGAPGAGVRATTPPASTLENLDFEDETAGWSTYRDANHPEVQHSVQLTDADGDGVPTRAAVLYALGHDVPAGWSRRVELLAGRLDVAVDVLMNGGAGDGRVRLLVDGVVRDEHVWTGPGAQRLTASLPSVTAGFHEVRLEAERSFLHGGSPAYVYDDLRLTGSAVPVRPAAPTNVTAARQTGGVRVGWTDVATTERAVRVERSPLGGPLVGAGFVEVGRAAANATSFVDTTAVAGQRYEYRVFATNQAGDSLPGPVVTTP